MKFAKIAFVLCCALVIGFSATVAGSNASLADDIVAQCASPASQSADSDCKTCTWECEGGGSGTTQTPSAVSCARLCEINCTHDGGCKSQSWGDDAAVFAAY